MIKINLISEEYIKKAVKKEKEVLISLIVILVIGILIGMYLIKVAQYQHITSQIKKIDKELAEIKPFVEEVKRIEKAKSSLNVKLNVVKSLIKKRFLYPKLMEKLASLLPNNVWFTSIDTSIKEKTTLSLIINAQALDNFSIAQFIENLESSSDFSDIELTSISSSQVKKTKIRNFGINCSYQF